MIYQKPFDGGALGGVKVAVQYGGLDQ